MDYGKPSPENVTNSIKTILEKEHDTKTVVKFFVGMLKILDEDPKGLKLVIMEQIDKMVSGM